MRIGINIVQPYPLKQLSEFSTQAGQIAGERATLPIVICVAQIQSIGTGVLRDHQEFFHAAGRELFGFGQIVRNTS